MSVHSEFRQWLDTQITVAENVANSAPVGTPLFEREYQKRRAETLRDVRLMYSAICGHYGAAHHG